MTFDILTMNVEELRLVLKGVDIGNLVRVAIGAGGVIIFFGIYAIVMLHRILEILSQIRDSD